MSHYCHIQPLPLRSSLVINQIVEPQLQCDRSNFSNHKQSQNTIFAWCKRIARAFTCRRDPHALDKLPSHASNCATHYTHSTPLSATSAIAHHLPSQHHKSSSDVSKQYCWLLSIDLWLALLIIDFCVDFLTKVKIFEKGISCSVFHVDSNSGLHFFI